MRLHRYFPLGKAYGEAFCNREVETEKLVSNIKRGVHTFLLAPRRYGKSSLCEKALTEAQLPWSKVDFHLAVTERDAERLIISGVVDLIGKSISQVDKLVTIIKNTVKNLKPKFGINTGSFALELEMSKQSSPAENVAEALLLLEKLLKQSDKQAVFLFDEFQEVGQISAGKGIEGAIRHVAQETQQLSIIFSGSNPHMIKAMFENERRPLYKLCKKLSLQRISQAHYQAHLNRAAVMAWHQVLSDEIFAFIMDATERHPYYVNALCDEIWAECDNFPSMDNVAKCWDTIVEGERSDLVKDFLGLSDNQRKVLIHIANYGGVELFSSQSFIQMEIPPGSLHLAVTTLLERDFIERIDNNYRLIVPIYRVLLKY